ncbi:MAG TPA: hypothetical protein VE135_05705 [Pyrinomonadaceae bacterium]|nr:hypothetical protein [Pyrinomonadaceae bacterium]
MLDPAIIQLIGTLGGSLGGVLVGAFVTWLSLRTQYRMKLIELEEEARLRGKELLFQAYQTKVDRTAGELNALGKGVGSILGYYQAAGEDERQQLSATFIRVAKETFGSVKERFEQLEEARKSAGLENSSPVQMQSIRDFIAVNMDNVKTQDDIQRTLIHFINASLTIPALWQEVLDERCEAIFDEASGANRSLSKRVK